MTITLTLMIMGFASIIILALLEHIERNAR
jgi:hypothetical protein